MTGQSQEIPVRGFFCLRYLAQCIFNDKAKMKICTYKVHTVEIRLVYKVTQFSTHCLLCELIIKVVRLQKQRIKETSIFKYY